MTFWTWAHEHWFFVGIAMWIVAGGVLNFLQGLGEHLKRDPFERMTKDDE